MAAGGTAVQDASGLMHHAADPHDGNTEKYHQNVVLSELLLGLCKSSVIYFSN